MIDVKEPLSPGWWLARLAKKLQGRLDGTDGRLGLAVLDSYLRGDPPMPEGAKGAREAYQAFQKKARTNYSRMIVEAPRQRMRVLGFRTAAGDDENGDDEALRIWRDTGMAVEFPEVLRSMLGLRDGYMIVGLDQDDQLIITAEDPRQVVTEHDPRQQRRIRAGAKFFRDDVEGLDLAYLYLPGLVLVAGRASSKAGTFNPRTWDWLVDRGGLLPDELADVVPIVRFRNERGVSEFEEHVDHLDRINHTILQRMYITTVQAFKQRAIKGDLPENYPAGHPREGQKIDYDEIFAADPGALWLLPETAELWESSTTDIRPLLDAVKDDVRDLAAVTFTTLYAAMPDSANQTAEGASVQREGLVFKVEDRITRAEDALVQVMNLAFRCLGDEQRAATNALEVIWAPVERYSLAEKYDAASKAPSGMPLQTVMTEVLQFPPSLAKRVQQQRADEVNAVVKAQLVEAARLQAEDGLSQAAAFAAVGLLVAAAQISSDQS